MEDVLISINFFADMGRLTLGCDVKSEDSDSL